MATARKGVYWQDKEVVLLLETLLEKEAGPRVIPSTHLETLSIFREVAETMVERGFRRTPEQCRSKFKREKASFFELLEEHDGPPPLPLERKLDVMRQLWEQGGSPSWTLRIPGASGDVQRRRVRRRMSESEEAGEDMTASPPHPLADVEDSGEGGSGQQGEGVDPENSRRTGVSSGFDAPVERCGGCEEALRATQQVNARLDNYEQRLQRVETTIAQVRASVDGMKEVVVELIQVLEDKGLVAGDREEESDDD